MMPLVVNKCSTSFIFRIFNASKSHRQISSNITRARPIASISIMSMSFLSTKADKKKVFVTRQIPKIALDLLEQQCDVNVWKSEIDPIPRDELLKSVHGVDAIICLLTEKIDADVLAAAGSQLRIVCTMSVGYEHIDLDACKNAGIAVGYTPDVLTECVAELAVTLLMTTARRVKEGIHAVLDGEWKSWSPLWLCGKELCGSTVGIVGLGRIGSAIATRLQPFGVQKVLYSSRNTSKNAATVGAEYVTFEELLRLSDFVVVCCTLTSETRGLFDKNAFKQMKNDAVFINISRGGLVNQDDLYDALVGGEIWAAGLDVTTPEPLPTTNPLLTIDNCTIFPHLGSSSVRTRFKMAELTALNTLAALNGRPMPCPLITPP